MIHFYVVAMLALHKSMNPCHRGREFDNLGRGLHGHRNHTLSFPPAVEFSYLQTFTTWHN